MSLTKMTNEQKSKVSLEKNLQEMAIQRLSLEEIIKLAKEINDWIKYKYVSGYMGHINPDTRIRVAKKGILWFLFERFVTFEIEAEYADLNLRRYYINKKNNYKYFSEIKKIYDKIKSKKIKNIEEG